MCSLKCSSPVWLMRRGREEEARLTLAWLRGGKYDIEPEIAEIKEVITEEEKAAPHSVLETLRCRPVRDLC